MRCLTYIEEIRYPVFALSVCTSTARNLFRPVYPLPDWPLPTNEQFNACTSEVHKPLLLRCSWYLYIRRAQCCISYHRSHAKNENGLWISSFSACPRLISPRFRTVGRGPELITFDDDFAQDQWYVYSRYCDKVSSYYLAESVTFPSVLGPGGENPINMSPTEQRHSHILVTS